MKLTKSGASVPILAAEPAEGDLTALAADPWATVAIPDDWIPVGRICRRIHQRLGEFTEHVVACIWDEIPFYATAAVPRDDVTLSVFRNLEMLILGLAESRGPTSEELRVRRELGHRRAVQGLAVDALLQAYHVGFRELWKEMVTEAADEPPGASDLLLTAASTVWEWVHQVTNAVADTYHDTLRTNAAQVAGMRQRMLELIRAGNLDDEELPTLGGGLGFDPRREFRAYAILTGTEEHPNPAKVQMVVEDAAGVHHAGVHAGKTIVISQRDQSREITKLLRDAFPKGIFGVGLSRLGYEGARRSVDDAQDALSAAIHGGSQLAEYASDWLFATLVRSADRLSAILAPAAAVANKHPHLVEAVEAFASARYSVSGAARALTLHNNTVAYRLRRWRQLTGWDPYTMEGLAASVTCLRLGENGGRSQH